MSYRGGIPSILAVSGRHGGTSWSRQAESGRFDGRDRAALSKAISPVISTGVSTAIAPKLLASLRNQ
jgi:hypothetical protein